ncbi:glycosyltransferase family 2 protein [Anoxybacillus flavithermus]|uniref:glycosyltransferase family 2 protein n=1 Tax=Anoxybacillus flavithermus TaxID=33934 RepID=UPI00237A778A|nr:glycosyltransferase [Anoxybacillus flavithermus]
MGVSVVIATYNRLLPLAELLESLSKQTYKPTQVIIVNDGGSSVQAAVDAYPELSIELMELSENVGHVEARNIGVRAATEDFIMLCDDDDLLLPCHMERMIANMNDADFVSHISHPLDKNREDFFIFLSNKTLEYKESKGVCSSWTFKFGPFMKVLI